MQILICLLTLVFMQATNHLPASLLVKVVLFDPLILRDVDTG